MRSHSRPNTKGLLFACTGNRSRLPFGKVNLTRLARQEHQAHSAHLQNPVPAKTEYCLANEAIHVVERRRTDQDIADNQRRPCQSEPGGYRGIPHPNQQSDCRDKAYHRNQSDECDLDKLTLLIPSLVLSENASSLR